MWERMTTKMAVAGYGRQARDQEIYCVTWAGLSAFTYVSGSKSWSDFLMINRISIFFILEPLVDLGMSYWIVASGSQDHPKDSTFEVLKSRITQKQRLCEEALHFDVPENLKFGSFDSLIKLVDDLGKYDSQIESIARRVERQALDIDATIELAVLTQRTQMTVDDYVSKFKWDDMKFPKGRTVQENIQSLLTSVQKIDEEVKNKTQQYTDAKQQASLFSKKEQASHVQRDLVDLLTPETVKEGDFVYSEHLTTVVVVVPRGADDDFLCHYESFDDFVVPESAHKIATDDKEGNSLWRVVMFKTATDAFKTSCRQHRITVRDFTYDKAKYHQVVEARISSEAELRKQESTLRRVCQVAFSDTMIAWTHLKAMRVFVEAILRFGVPPRFSSFLIKPGKFSSKQSKLRSELLDILCTGTGGIYGHAISESKEGHGAADDEGGEYFPYVFVPFTPVTAKTG
jgi:V-type H+-transporting ATPase subunit C